MRQKPVVISPQRNQKQPIRLLHRLDPNISRLIVRRKLQSALQHGPNKSLMVVRSRIDQMPNQLLPRPPATQHRRKAFRFTHIEQPWLGRINHPPQLSAKLPQASFLRPANIHARDASVISEMIPSELTQYTHQTIKTSFSICVR